jgi:flagellar basal body-associated protein FliL
MSEETNEGTWSGLKKTIIGMLSTVVAGGGTWLGVTLFGGHEEEPKEEPKTEAAAPAPVVVNVQQTQDNKQKVENGGPTVIRERVVEKPTQPAAPVAKPQEESW